MSDELSSVSGGFWVYCCRCWCQCSIETAHAIGTQGDRAWLCPDCWEAEQLTDRGGSVRPSGQAS
jgi:hypothetical protein